MRVSVVVPFRDAERTIGACADALLGQDDPGSGVEILMVDHGSTDSSFAVLAERQGITVLHATPGAGAYAARNIGIAAARGDVVAFTDPDCVPEREWVARIASALGTDACLVALGRRDPGVESGALSLLAAYELAKDEYVLSGTEAALYYGYTNNMGVRRSVFDEVGPFLELPRGADSIFVQAVVERASCAAVRYVPDARVRHLELDGVRTYYRKMFIYGRHRRLNRERRDVAALDLSHRLEVLRRMRGAHGYGAMRTAALSGLLAGGLAAWQLGRLSGRLRPAAGAGTAGRA